MRYGGWYIWYMWYMVYGIWYKIDGMWYKLYGRLRYMVYVYGFMDKCVYG